MSNPIFDSKKAGRARWAHNLVAHIVLCVIFRRSIFHQIKNFDKMPKYICPLGVLTTLNFIGACSSKVYLIFVDPKSKISEKSDPY